MALDYSKYTFEEVVNQLTSLLKKKDTWEDAYESSTGQTLIELFAAVVDLMNYYVERRAEESYLQTAKLRSSVVNIVSLLGYLPRRRVSATGSVKFTLSESRDYDVYIPKFTKLRNPDGLYYLTQEEGVIHAGGTEVTLSCIQGELKEETVTADGSSDFEYTLQESGIENSNLFVSVDGVLWQQVDSFLFSQAEDLVYKVEVGLDGKLIVIFGNNRFGKAPEAGSLIKFQYIKSEGSAGNIYTTGVSMTVVDTIVDEQGNPVDISAVTASKFLGGEDEESMEEIKYYAPKVFATGDRAVTKEDWKVLIEKFRSVVSAQVWGEYEENPPNQEMFNVVKVSLVLENWALPDDAFKEELRQYLDDYKTITTKINFVDVEIYDVVPVAIVFVNKLYSLSSVKANVEAVIEDYFSLNRDVLGRSARLSDLMRAIDSVEGVEYVHLYLDIKENIGTGDGSATSFSGTLHLTPVKKFSVKVYRAGNLEGQDDGQGNITGGNISSGSVNYDTGAISVTFSSAPAEGEKIDVRYQQDKNGDIEVNRNQALKVLDKEITVEYVR